MNSKTLRLIGIVLSVFAVFYFGYQVYMFTYTPYETEMATAYNYTDQIELHGMAIKNEQIIDGAYDGIVRYEQGNSLKVSAGSAVATIYASESDLLNNALIDEKNQQIQLLTDLENKKTTISSNAQNIVSSIKKEQAQLISSVASNRFSALDKIQNDFLTQLLKQQIILNPDVSYAEEIASLQAEISTLSGQITGNYTQIQSPVSGYFTNEIDGYEQSVTMDALNDVSLDQVQRILNETKPDFTSTGIGKVITATEWYFVGLIPTKNVSRLQTGQTISIVFPHDTSYRVTAKIYDLHLYAENEFSVIVLSSNIMNENIIDLRIENASIVFDTTKGLKVPKEAVHMVNMEVEKEITEEASSQQAEGEPESQGEKKTVTETVSQPGVYVNMGQVVKFKKIKILNESDNYVICSMENGEAFLQLYDEIILGGTDLRDNKPIK